MAGIRRSPPTDALRDAHVPLAHGYGKARLVSEIDREHTGRLHAWTTWATRPPRGSHSGPPARFHLLPPLSPLALPLLPPTGHAGKCASAAAAWAPAAAAAAATSVRKGRRAALGPLS